MELIWGLEGCLLFLLEVAGSIENRFHFALTRTSSLGHGVCLSFKLREPVIIHSRETECTYVVRLGDHHFRWQDVTFAHACSEAGDYLNG